MGKSVDFVKRAKIAFVNAKINCEVIKHSAKECTSAKRALQKKLRLAGTTGEKQQIICALGLVKGYCTKLKFLHGTTGAGLSQTKTRQNCRSLRVKWLDVESAFGGRIRTGAIINMTHKEPKSFLEDCAKVFQRHIKKILRKEMALKVNAVFCGEFHIIKGNKEIHENKFMNTKNVTIYRETDLNALFNDHIRDSILKKLEEFQERDSGWALAAIVNLAIGINKFTPQLGSSYIPLPRQIEAKKACINVKNNDDACFAWAVVSALYPAGHHSDRMSSYPDYKRELKLAAIQFPMTVRQILRFKKQNGLSINVYILKKTKEKFIVLPTYLTKDKKEQHINLFMVQNIYYEKEDGEVENENDEDEDIADPVRYHFVWIKNLSRLLSSQLSNNQHQKRRCTTL